jgi:protein O-mannosyl-transferase
MRLLDLMSRSASGTLASRSDSIPPRGLRLVVVLAALGLVAAIFAAYFNGFSAPFVFDDVDAIRDNPTLKNWADLGQIFSPPARTTVAGRPVLNASFAWSAAFGDGGPKSHHWVNVAIHAAAALMLFGLVRRTLLLPRLAPKFGADAVLLGAGAALLWGLHPLQTEAVTYLVQRAESMMGFFYLLTMYCGLRGATASDSRRVRWFGAAIVACSAGMATKEVMVSAPIVALLYDRALIASGYREIWRERGPYYLGLAATWIVLAAEMISVGGNRGGSIGFGVGIGWGEHALTQFQAITHYLWLTAWPHPLVFEYEPEWVRHFADIVPSVIVVVLAVALTLRGLRRNSAIGVAGALGFAVLAPTSFMPAPSQLIVEHRMYLPLAAIIVVSVCALYRNLGRRVVWIMLACALGWGGITSARNADYRTEESLWADTVAKRPHNAFAHGSLGAAYTRSGRLEAALAECQEAVRLNPNRALLRYNLAKVLERVGRGDQAIAEYAESARLEPQFAAAHNNYAAALARVGRMDEAKREFETSVHLQPSDAHAHFNLAALLADMGHGAEALPEFQIAVALQPNFPEALTRWGTTLALLGHIPEAMERYEQALRVDPSDVTARNKQGVVYLMIGRVPDAIACFDAALKIDPNNPETKANLAMARRKLAQ